MRKKLVGEIGGKIKCQNPSVYKGLRHFLQKLFEYYLGKIKRRAKALL